MAAPPPSTVVCVPNVNLQKQDLTRRLLELQFTQLVPNTSPSIVDPTTLSAAETYNEGVPKNLTVIVVQDPDTTAIITVTFTLSDVAAGTISTGTAGNVTSTFSNGVWRAQGSVANVNALLSAPLVFTPSTSYNTNFTIATRVTDGIATDLTGTKAMTGIPSNVAPTASNMDAPETYTEDTPKNLTIIQVTDDSPSVVVTLTLSDPAAGTISTGTFVGETSTTSTFVSGVWRAEGSVTNVNALLAAPLVFTPSSNYNSTFSIATRVSDGIATDFTGSKLMTGVAVNDAPTATYLSQEEVYTVNTPRSLTPIVVTDVDTSANIVATLTLSTTSAGSLTVVPAGGITPTYTSGTGVWRAEGSVNAVNACLAIVQYVPATNFTTIFTIATNVTDGTASVSGTKSMISFSGASSWYDGTDPLGTGTPPANNASITTWNDKSGNSRHMVATSASGISPPTYNTTTFGASSNKPGIVFINNARLIRAGLAQFSLSTTNTICIYFKTTSLSQDTHILGSSTNSGGRYQILRFTNNTTPNYISQFNGNTNGVTSGMWFEVPTTTTYMSIMRQNGTAGSLRVNGTNCTRSTTVGVSTMNNEAPFLGNIGSIADLNVNFQGHIGFVATFNTVLTDAQCVQVEAYVSSLFA